MTEFLFARLEDVILPSGGLTGQVLIARTANTPIWSSDVTLNTLGLTVPLPGASGGTGVANTGKTITIGGNVTLAGAFNFTGTLTAGTTVTFPITGTLATLAGAEALTNKSLNGNTVNAGTGNIPNQTSNFITGGVVYANATQTFVSTGPGTATTVLHGNAGGTGPSYGAVSLTADVSGILPLGNGGTGADLSATGGTSQVLKQTSVGGVVTVARLAGSDLSDTFTGTGSLVRQTTPSLITPILGVATATSINKVAFTAPATGATLALIDGTTLTGPAASGTAMTLGNAETITGVKTFGTSGNTGQLQVAGSGSGSTTITAQAVASGTMALPAATSTIVGVDVTQTLTNKTINLSGNTVTGTTAQFNTALSDNDFATLAGSETLTNKSINGSNNTITNIGGASIRMGSDAQGDVLYFNGTNYVRLAAGSSGNFLKTLGAGANPTWAAVPGGGDMLAANNLSDVANVVTARQNLSVAQLAAMAEHNAVINGAFNISQIRGTTNITLTNNTAAYIMDMTEAMYKHNAGTASVRSGQLAAASFPVAINGFQFGHILVADTAITSPATGDFAKHRMKIIGSRVAPWGWGASGAKSIVIAFQVYSVASGVTFVKISNDNQSRTYYHEITLAAGLNFVAFSVPGDTSGTWQKTTGIGLTFELFSSGKETTPVAVLDTWGSTDKVQTTNSVNLLGTNLNYTLLTGVYIDVGTQLPVQADMAGLMRVLSRDLELCEIYIEKSPNFLITPATAIGSDTGDIQSTLTVTSGTARTAHRFRVTKALTPSSVLIYNPVNGNNSAYNYGPGLDFGTTTASTITEKGFRVAADTPPAGSALGDRWGFHFLALATL